MIYLAYFIYVIFIFSAHHFCLCMTMIVWFVTRGRCWYRWCSGDGV